MNYHFPAIGFSNFPAFLNCKTVASNLRIICFMTEKTILVVDDDEAVRDSLALLFRRKGWQVFEAYDGFEALKIYREQRADIVLIDMVLPHMNGIGLVKELRVMDAEVPLVIYTGYPSMEMLYEAYTSGTTDFIAKPCDSDELTMTIEYLMENRKALRSMGDGDHAKEVKP